MRDFTLLEQQITAAQITDLHPRIKDIAKMTAFMGHLREGLSRKNAAVLVGFDPQDVKDAYDAILGFRIVCDQARAVAVARLTHKVIDSDDPKVAIRALESMDSETWGPKQKIDHTSGDQPMKALIGIPIEDV